MKVFALVSAMIVLLATAALRSDDTKKDLEQLQGSWTVTAIESEDQRVTEEQLKTMAFKLTIKGENFTYEQTGQPSTQGTFKIDAAKTPKTIDSKTSRSDGKTDQTMGIYELQGDTLKICYVAMGHERPKEFKASAGNLIVHRREKR